LLTPVSTEGVLDDPELLAISLSLPTDYLDDLLSVKLEGFVSAMIDT
jgi:hypothetical protein